MTSQAATKAERPPGMDELDSLLDEVAETRFSWAADRPLLPREAAAILRKHERDPAAVEVGRSRETIRACEHQLRIQAAAFAKCSAALLAGDAGSVPGGNPMGSAFAEVRELLADAVELRALMRDAGAVAVIQKENETLALLFGEAGQRCLDVALTLQQRRHALHAADYRELLVHGIREQAAETARRATNSAKGRSA